MGARVHPCRRLPFSMIKGKTLAFFIKATARTAFYEPSATAVGVRILLLLRRRSTGARVLHRAFRSFPFESPRPPSFELSSASGLFPASLLVVAVAEAVGERPATTRRATLLTFFSSISRGGQSSARRSSSYDPSFASTTSSLSPRTSRTGTTKTSSRPPLPQVSTSGTSPVLAFGKR